MSGGAVVEVSVVVPVYRNADTLEELAQRVGRALGTTGRSWELLLVDDASPDTSAAVARRLAAEESPVGSLLLPRNVGQQRAVLAGIEGARGRWVVTMDADLQDPPEAIPRLLEKAEEGFEVVFAGRRGRFQGPGRRLTSRLFKLLLGWLCGVPRDAGLFLVMSRRAVREVARYRSPGVWVVAAIGLAGLSAASIPVERHHRPRGRSAYSGWRRLRLAAGALAFALARRLVPPPAVAGGNPDLVGAELQGAFLAAPRREEG